MLEKQIDEYRMKKIDMHILEQREIRVTKRENDVDEKQKTVTPADSAVPKVEKILGIKNLYDAENIEMSHCFMAALRAKSLMKRDRDYVIKNGEVVSTDNMTSFDIDWAYDRRTEVTVRGE